VIVDNGDLDGERLTPFANERIIRSTWTSPEVNIARKINQGAALASGDAIVILNDDVQPVAPDWIEQMLAHLEKPHVGAVGAKLLYPKDRTIQHAGIVMCDGLPEHVRRYAPRDDRGYLESSSATRNYLAVTGAVAMVSASNFRSVGGYSEDLPIDYNDVDFSFKLVKRGLSIVYEPRAELMHFESISIVKPPRPQDAALFSQRWASIPTDPFYNQYCFSVHPATFEPAYSRRRN
jgi:GT2 family glycosyltransferase